MQVDADYLVAVGAIYEAALHAKAWPAAVGEVARVVGGHGGMLMVSDTVEQDLQITVTSSNYSPQAARAYVSSQIDPDEARWIEALDRAPPRTIVKDIDVWPDQAAYASMSSVQWLLNQGLFHRFAVRLCTHGGWRDLLAILYDQDRDGIAPEEVRQMLRLLPHLARAVELRRPFALLERRYGAVLAALDRLGIGVLLVREDCEVILANQEARRVLESGDGIDRDPQSRLRAAAEAGTGTLRQAVRSAARAAVGQSTKFSASFSVARRSRRDPYHCEVSSVREDGTELSGGFNGALLTIVDPDRRALTSIDGLCKAYGLTGAEAEVCRRMAEGFTAAEIADERGVGLTTIKSQTRSIFAKTATRNRAELVRRAVTIVPPLL